MSLKLLHHLKVTTLCFGHIVFAFSKCLSTLFISLLPSEIFHGTFVFYCLLMVSCVIKLVMVIFQKLCIIESTGVSSFDILTSVTFLASLLGCVLDKSLGRSILLRRPVIERFKTFTAVFSMLHKYSSYLSYFGITLWSFFLPSCSLI